MRIRVLFFGMLKDLAGQADASLTLPEHATIADVFDHYQSRIPRLRDLRPSLAVSVNQQYAASNFPLKDGDEVALLPPVSGGSDPQGPRIGHASIVREKIDVPSLLGKIRQPQDGAVLLFEGVVRDHSRGRRTLFLDYEAYEEMALKQLENLAEQAFSRFPVREIAIVHRVGRLQIGETSVAIVVASAHRSAAFDASRWLIDTLKRTVPIWKKEYFEDGAIWADGEPFPAEIQGPASSYPKKEASN
jgi:MoaE-MoaD fusion protein